MISNFDGITDNNKPSSKVLRPPGGGSSDIFGAEMPQTPRSVKNHMQSNIFSCDKNAAIKNNGDQPRRGQKNVDSYTRLFGEPERPITPAKNHMKSNIPFGANTEAAQQLLVNGNGHHNHHTNGKCGSVSSTSSSVSSSTENLKMNGVSKTEVDPACHVPTPIPSETSSIHSTTVPADLHCEDRFGDHTARSRMSEKQDGDLSARSRMTEKTDRTDADLSARSKHSERTESNQEHTTRSKIAGKADVGAGDVASQTRRDSGCNPDNPYSLSKLSQPSDKLLDACVDKPAKPPTPRNPITGLGLGEDGVGGIKPKKPKSRRDGNPVTGEGYKPSNELNNTMPSMNGANQVINKNRIPPGGFSSGLW